MDIETDMRELNSPLLALHDMDRLMDDFGEALRRADDCLHRANDNYMQMETCREVAEASAAQMSHTLKQVLAENGNLVEEDERLRAQLEDERHRCEALQQRVNDLEKQLEARRFNPELRAQNDKLLAENEEMKRKRKKDMEARVTETRNAIFDALREALAERDQLVACCGNPSEWLHTLDLMRTTFRKLPELTQHIDNLMSKHLNEPKGQQPCMTVNNPQNCNFVEQQSIR